MEKHMRVPLFAAVALSVMEITVPGLVRAQVDVDTWHNDNARTGQNASEAILTPGKVNSSNFGELFQVALDGKVDAEPLYASAVSIQNQGKHNVVYAGTEHDSVYAFDADNGKILWKVSVLEAGETPSDPRNCSQVVPEIGITATPVIDRTKGLLYVAAMSKDAAGNYYQRLHALSLASGQDLFKELVQATTPGTGDGSSNDIVTFAPEQYKERPGLLQVGSTLYTSWGSHCDHRPYSGWVLAYSTETGKQTGAFNFAPNGSDAAPWNAGAGPAADAAGNVFVSLGNGTFDTTPTGQGFPSLGDFGNAVVKLSPGSEGLQATDYWTMYNSNSESGVDTDLGSGGLMLLPGQVDVNGVTRKLAVAAGKDSNLYVLDQTNLGKFDPTSNATLYQELPGALSNGVWASPAYFNGHIYYGSVNSVLRSFDLKSARVSSSPSSSTAETFTYPGTTPSVSSYGTQNGIVWAVENSSPAVLHAYDTGNLAVEFYNSNQAPLGRDHFGNGNKFITPTIANGKVYVGTPNSVAVFGILPQNKPPLADGDYNITNSGSLLLLTDYADSPSTSTEIIQYTTYPGLYQTWFFSWQGNGYYLVQNAATGLFLSAPEGALGTSPALHASPTFDDSQLWALTSSASGFVIRSKSTGLVLGTPARDDNPAGVQVQTGNGGESQGWSVQAAK
jgi:hypothetical protein